MRTGFSVYKDKVHYPAMREISAHGVFGLDYNLSKRIIVGLDLSVGSVHYNPISFNQEFEATESLLNRILASHGFIY